MIRYYIDHMPLSDVMIRTLRHIQTHQPKPRTMRQDTLRALLIRKLVKISPDNRVVLMAQGQRILRDISRQGVAFDEAFEELFG